MDLKLQLWLIQAAFLVQKSSLPTLVNNSNFSESHPWQSTGVMLMGSKTQLLHVETGLPVLQETADRPVSGSASVGFLSCDRPREEVDGKSASASGLRNCTHTYAHTSGISWQNPRRKNKHIVFWTLLHYGMSMLLFLQIYVRHINI